MAHPAHTSVLPESVLELIEPRSGGVYVDGTLGAGGHAALLLEHSAPAGRLIGIDRDPAALALSRQRLAEFGERVTYVHGAFAQVDDHLRALDCDKVDGLLLDLGVSSMQLDEAERGFSFSREGPIDMRMDRSEGESALAFIRRIPADELADILREFGEERYSRRVAKALKEAARASRLHTTLDLADAVSEAIPAKSRRHLRIHPATRTFQALRIAINGELDELARFLEIFPDLLATGGRCAIISFHSLEDRMVKHRFRELAKTSSLPPDLAERAGERVHPICVPLTKKPVTADPAEVSRNPRARSAKLRACQKVGE